MAAIKQKKNLPEKSSARYGKHSFEKSLISYALINHFVGFSTHRRILDLCSIVARFHMCHKSDESARHVSRYYRLHSLLVLGSPLSGQTRRTSLREWTSASSPLPNNSARAAKRLMPSRVTKGTNGCGYQAGVTCGEMILQASYVVAATDLWVASLSGMPRHQIHIQQESIIQYHYISSNSGVCANPVIFS